MNEPEQKSTENVQNGQEDPQSPEPRSKLKEEQEKRSPYIEIAYDEDTKEWHWCLWAGNGRPYATSPHGFLKRHECYRGVRKTLDAARDHPKMKIFISSE